MRDTKLVQLLQRIPEIERKRFAQYVQASYFNTIPRLGQLLEVLEQRLLRYKSRNLTEQEAFAAVFPQEEYDQNRLRKDCSALLKLLGPFLAQAAYDHAPHLQAVLRLRSLNQLECDNYFPLYHAQAIAGLDTQAIAPAALHETQVQLGLERYRHDMRQPARTSDVAIDDLIAHQELAYMIRKMELCYVQLNHRLVTGKGVARDNAPFLTFIGAYLNALPPITQMHYHLYRCTLEPDWEENYLQFKEILTHAHLEPSVQEEMYTAAINYCARRINAGHRHYQVENFAIYQTMLTRKLFGGDGKLLASHFKNIVVLGCQLSEFVWVRDFVASFADHLQGEFNRNAHHFALGYIAFCAGDFVEAEPHLYRVLDDYEDFYYGIDARMTLLRLHYETSNWVSLDSLLDSSRMLVQRSKKLSALRRATLLAFIRFLRRLAHLPAYDSAARLLLVAALQKARPNVHITWLLSKLAMPNR